jgi:hypothetical protein
MGKLLVVSEDNWSKIAILKARNNSKLKTVNDVVSELLNFYLTKNNKKKGM